MNSTSSTNADEYSPDRFIGGPLTVAICTVGLLINILATLRLSQLYRTSQCFVLYCLAHLLSDSIVLLIFLFYVAPKLLLPEIWQQIPPGYGKKVGFLSLTFEYCSFYTTMLITLNRAFVVIFPFKNTIFTGIPFACAAVVTVWGLALATTMVTLVPDCGFVFKLVPMVWKFLDTECGQIVNYYLHRLFSLTFFALLIAIDVLTIVYSHYRSKYVWKLGNGVQATETSRRKRQEIGFFVQSCVVSACFVITLCCYHIFYHLVDSILWRFSQTTLVWEVSHCVQGLVVIVFNRNPRHSPHCNNTHSTPSPQMVLPAPRSLTKH